MAQPTALRYSLRRRTAATAAGLIATDAYSAYILAYDATRFACVSLLAQQGMRATTSGGHYAIERAVRAQFGPGFRPFGDLRRRRNELEYPRLPCGHRQRGRSCPSHRGCATVDYSGEGTTRPDFHSSLISNRSRQRSGTLASGSAATRRTSDLGKPDPKFEA